VRVLVDLHRHAANVGIMCTPVGAMMAG
jgi:hypothetical protein